MHLAGGAHATSWSMLRPSAKRQRGGLAHDSVIVGGPGGGVTLAQALFGMQGSAVCATPMEGGGVILQPVPSKCEQLRSVCFALPSRRGFARRCSENVLEILAIVARADHGLLLARRFTGHLLPALLVAGDSSADGGYGGHPQNRPQHNYPIGIDQQVPTVVDSSGSRAFSANANATGVPLSSPMNSMPMLHKPIAVDSIASAPRSTEDTDLTSAAVDI